MFRSLFDVVSPKITGYPEKGGFGENPKQELLDHVKLLDPNNFNIFQDFPALSHLTDLLGRLPSGVIAAVLPKLDSNQEPYWIRKAASYVLGADIVVEQDRYVNGSIQEGRGKFVLQNDSWGQQPIGSEPMVTSRLVVTSNDLDLTICTSQQQGDDRLNQLLNIQYAVDHEGINVGSTVVTIKVNVGEGAFYEKYEFDATGTIIRITSTLNGKTIGSLEDLTRLQGLSGSSKLLYTICPNDIIGGHRTGIPNSSIIKYAFLYPDYYLVEV